MTCAQCGGATELTGATHSAPAEFTERYRCVQCGALGTVSGSEESPPSTWDRHGAVFGGPA